MEKPTVAVVLVNYKRTEDTLACLDSLRMIPEEPKVIVVDNASGPTTVSTLSQCQGITLLPLPENLGYAGGNNVGIRHAMLEGADFVWLLNNDTAVAVDTLTWLLKTADSDSSIGIVGSKIYYHHDPNRLWYAGATISKLGKPNHLGLSEIDVGQYDGTYRDVGYVTGCSMLVRREVIEQIGFLPEDYFMYYEDVEWSLRAQRGGWRTVIEPRLVLWHKEGASSGGSWRERSKAQDYYDLRNGWLFVDRNYSGVWRIAGKLYLFVRLIRKFLRVLIRGERNPGTKMATQALALYHAWTSQFGRMP